MYNIILVPLDGSERAETILPHVENLARHQGAKVVLTSVVEPVSKSFVLDPDAPPKYKYDSAATDKAWEYLKQQKSELRDKNIEADTLLMYGPAVEGIIHAANEAEADMIALTSQGRTGLQRVIYGSTASGVMNRVRRPLLLVHSHTEKGTEANRNILVPLDGSKRSEVVIPHVEGVARLYDAEVTLLRIIITAQDTAEFDDLDEIPEGKELHGHLLERLGQEQEIQRYKDARDHLVNWRDHLRQKGFNVKAWMMHGRPVKIIAKAAEELDADLIVMTNKGRTGLAEVFYGSVASGVLNRIFRPLLLIRSD